MAANDTETNADAQKEDALSVDSTGLAVSPRSTGNPTDDEAEEPLEEEKTTEMTQYTANTDTKEEGTDIKVEREENAPLLSLQQSDFNSDKAKEFRITGSFKTHWQQYVHQPFVTAKVTTHDGKEEVLHFAEPLAPRRIYVALKIKRLSDVDNVNETYRCRFHIYFDWLLTKQGYLSYVEYQKRSKNKKVEWIPPFAPRYEFLNIVEAHLFEEVDYGIEGPYRVQRIKDFDKNLVGFDPEHAFMCRMRLEVDATFCEELELESFPVDCQDLSVVMREGWGTKRAIFVPELRTKKGKPSDFARVDPSFSVLDEWEFHNSRIEFRSSDPRESRSDTEYFLLTIRFKMRRKYSVYLWNVVLYMFSITLMSLSCFALSNNEIVGERMGLAVTLLLTAVAFQDVVFEELPNVAYLTLLHKYIITSFCFIAGVSVQTACTAIGVIPLFEQEFFDFPGSFSVFVAIFVSYNLYFLIQAGWLRHWESKKLYMDSEELENYVEERKHQFKMAWIADVNQSTFRGLGDRIVSFVDVDPMLQIENEDAARSDSFCRFVCRW
eukprot:CAMPEP_0197023124 /NCGR_PEP_ID=MMETSP1384-20130603/3912_1 /TAXON_ID=29189 /ORGANISM="Ammonia sp." /LENGTH=549 /DNA_ID=CAMNT_0042451297 /DNA_START=31 /DNA_END=1677 /DNA_ORIENTATION=+